MRGKQQTKKQHKWSMKYKKSINCARPKGFSQKQYCKYGRNKTARNKGTTRNKTAPKVMSQIV